MKSIVERFIKESEIGNWFKSMTVQLFISCVLIFIVLHLTYSLSLFSYDYDYTVGAEVTENIVLESDYHDEISTEFLKEQVKYEVDTIYTIDPKVYVDAKESVDSFYNKAYDIRAEYSDENDIRVRVLTYLLKDSFELTQEELTILAEIDDVALRLTENYVYAILKDTLSSEVTDENIISKKRDAKTYFDTVDQISDQVKPIVLKITNYHITANSQIDEVATEDAIKSAQNEIDNVMISAGTVIAKSNEPLSVKAYNILNDLNLNDLHTFEQNIPLLSMDAQMALLLVLMYVVLLYFYSSRKKSVKQIYLNFVIFVLTYLLAFGLKSVSVYLIPLATVGMLISLLDELTTGIIYSFFLAIIFGVIFSLHASLIAFTVLGCIISAILVNRAYQRGKIFLAGLMVSLINTLMIFGIYFMSGISITESLEQVFYGILAGVVCSILTIGSLPLWETLFKILTPLKLLELANPNHPLLKKLLLEAPGTYHHSILVANLSEAAVHDIGGNAILARVGAYFHDVGKIDRPYFYAENQYDINNPHDQLVPHVSAKIIKDHVKRGLELSKTYRLPKEINAFIEQHHGTTLIKYFYHKATENNESDLEINPLSYMYDGPEPENKEIAVVMLADSVEAAVRSMKQGDVKALISKIIDDKIKSHQLDDSHLTLGEIEVIKKSFYSNLSSAFHDRVEYPELEEKHINIVK